MQPENYLTCTYCSKQFEGTIHQVRKFKYSQGTNAVCCSYECIRVHRSKIAKKYDIDPTLNCTYCGSEFKGSPSQVSRFRLSGGTKKLCCSSECRVTHRREIATQMHKDGLLVWGSPAQVSHLSVLHAANTGEAAYNWKGGRHSVAMRAAARERGAKAREHRASIQPPCGRCGNIFEINVMQRSKWVKHGDTATYFCQECRATPAFHLYKHKQVRTYADEAAYYSDATCFGCEVVFSPNRIQRAYRVRKPNAAIYCTDECRKQNMPKGPVSWGWKHGGCTVVMKQVRELRHEINKLISEGATK